MMIGLVDYDKYDVALFINAKQRAKWSQLVKEFVENQRGKHISRQTLSNYLKELCEDGLIKKTVDKKLLLLRIILPVYEVTKSGRKILQKIADKKEIYAFIDSANQEEIDKLHKEIVKIKER